MKEQYIKIHKKRLLHLSIVMLIFSALFIVSIFLIYHFPDKVFIPVPLLLLVASFYLREYWDWIDEKYPREEKKNEDIT